MGVNHEGNDLLLLVSTCERSIIIIVVNWCEPRPKRNFRYLLYCRRKLLDHN